MKKLIYLLCIICIIFCGCNKTETTKDETLPHAENQNQKYGIYQLNISKKLLSNNAVGNDWNFKYYYNGQEIKNGHKIINSLEIFQFITIEVKVTEKDKINDIGKGEITLGLCNGAKGKTEITVIENAGTYKGNKAIWEIQCELEMIGKQ